MEQFGLTDDERELIRDARLDRALAGRDVDLRDGQALGRDQHAASRDRAADEGVRLMARIIGGIGASHAPSMEHVYDAGAEARESDEWAAALRAVPGGVASGSSELRPDRLVVVYNDHMDAFFLDAYPTFALGVAETYPIADEGFGARPFPPIAGDAALGWHIARSLVADEFDITICQELEVDHGVISPLPMVDFAEGDGDWKIPIVPLAVNVILHPLPTPAPLLQARARRCAGRSSPTPRTCAWSSSAPAGSRTS